MNFSKKIEEFLKKNETKGFAAQLPQIAVIELPITEDQLKILITIIENLGQLSDNDLLELSSDEKAHIDGLYQTAIRMLDITSNRGLDDNKNYTSQLDVIARLSNGNDK